MRDSWEEVGLQGGVAESGVGQTEAKFVAGCDVAGNVRAVINQGPFRKIGLCIVLSRIVWYRWRQKRTIVCFGLADGVGQTARGRLRAIHDLDERAAAVLTGQVGVDDGCDIRFVNPCVDNPYSSIVDYHYCVVTLAGNIRHESVRVGVGEHWTVIAFGGKLLEYGQYCAT